MCWWFGCLVWSMVEPCTCLLTRRLATRLRMLLQHTTRILLLTLLPIRPLATPRLPMPHRTMLPILLMLLQPIPPMLLLTTRLKLPTTRPAMRHLATLIATRPKLARLLINLAILNQGKAVNSLIDIKFKIFLLSYYSTTPSYTTSYPPASYYSAAYISPSNVRSYPAESYYASNYGSQPNYAAPYMASYTTSYPSETYYTTTYATQPYYMKLVHRLHTKRS